MIPGLMPGPALKLVAGVVAVAGAATSLAACRGDHAVQLAGSSPYHHGAQLFNQHCGGCHTLDVAGTEGSATKVRDREHTDGPNFNVRKEQVNQILYAIRNGGFSGAIMPENIVVGSDAQAVAQFLARYSGLKAKQTISVNQAQGGSSSAGSSGNP